MCKTCGEENADRNASFNIAYRALGYISKVGVTVNIPITLASTDRSTMMTRETRLTMIGSCSLLVFFSSSILLEYDQIPLCVKH